MICLWLYKIYSEGQTWVPALPGPSNDHTRRTRCVYIIVLHHRCSEVLWKSYICTGFCLLCLSLHPCSTWREHGCRYITACKSDLLSYIPVQQLEMRASRSCSCTYTAHWAILLKCMRHAETVYWGRQRCNKIFLFCFIYTTLFWKMCWLISFSHSKGNHQLWIKY